jgi:PAS domain S-box-containing protein
VERLRFLLRPGWRYLAPPLVVWLVVMLGAVGGALWVRADSRAELGHRFALRVSIAAQFVATYVDELVTRQRAQAVQFLADESVGEETFTRAVAAFGYPAAVLLDGRGRLLQVVPVSPALIGQNLTERYAHLHDALTTTRPTVSSVVPAASGGQPIVAFAVPFETRYGRRVFSGGVEVRSSPLGAYLTHAIAVEQARMYLVDGGGTVVGSNQDLAAVTELYEREPNLSGELARAAAGTFAGPDREWRYESRPVEGTPWRLVATVPTDVLYEPMVDATVGGAAAVTVLGIVGLVAALAAAAGVRNRARLHDSEARFRGIFDNSLVGMLISEPGTGLLTRVNQAFCDLVGYTADELLWVDWRDLTHPDDRARNDALVAAALAGTQRGFELEKRYLHADGHEVPVLLHCTLIRDDRGRPVHFTTQVVDIGERHRLEQEQERSRTALAEHARDLERANRDLHTAQQRTADLVAMLSHDVRQPLGVINGYCSLLLEAWEYADDTEKRRDLTRIRAAGTTMLQLVEEILTLSELDNADVRPRQAPIRVDAAVAQALAGLYAEHRAPVPVDADGGLAVFADARHLQRILVNLLSNARKYGGDDVEVHAHRRGDRIAIAVCDRGEGVPPEFVPHLFERYARAERGVAPTRSGTGLGLYIAHQLAVANGGALHFERNEPRGSRFVLTLVAAEVPVRARLSVSPRSG